MKIDFIVLACSYKHGNRCVAGIDLTNKRLIRLVSENASTNYAIPKDECKVNGRNLLPMDVIVVEIKGKAPNLGAQTENYIVTSPLVKMFTKKATLQDINPYRYKSDFSPYPFDSKDPFLNYGAYYHRDYSLCLIPAYAVKFKTIKNNEGKDKTKISFDVYKYNREKVTLEDYSVTDPQYTFYEGTNRAGKIALGKAYLLISLGQDDDSENYYKYVSGIIDLTKENE